MLESLLRNQSANEEKPLSVARFAGNEEISRYRHGGDHRIDLGRQLLRFILQPARNCRDGSRVLEHVPEQRLGHAYRAREAHIGSMKRRHKRNVRESGQPCPDDAAREPPMSMYYLRLEIPASAHSLNEIGAEENDEGKLRRPRRCDVARHVTGVRELFVSPRRIAKPFYRHSFDL